MFRLQNNVPYYYVNNSRDFQLFCRLYDVAFTSAKCDIDNIISVTDSYECPDRLLEVIATRVGFFHARSVPADALRMILRAFPYIMKHKGTEGAIEDCINLFLRYNKAQDAKYSLQYEDENIILTLETTFGNEYILDILLSYVIPTGCYLIYQIASINTVVDLNIPVETLILATLPDDTQNSMVVPGNGSNNITDFLSLGTVGFSTVYTPPSDTPAGDLTIHLRGNNKYYQQWNYAIDTTNSKCVVRFIPRPELLPESRFISVDTITILDSDGVVVDTTSIPSTNSYELEISTNTEYQLTIEYSDDTTSTVIIDNA